MSGGRSREAHSPAVEPDSRPPLPFSPRATAWFSAGRVLTHGQVRQKPGPWVGTQVRNEVSSYNSPLQSWHWSFDSTIVRRRLQRHLSTCPGVRPMTTGVDKSSSPRIPQKPRTPMYHDKAGLRQPVEDALRDHDRTHRLSAVKNDYNRLFELQLQGCRHNIHGLENQRRLRTARMAKSDVGDWSPTRNLNTTGGFGSTSMTFPELSPVVVASPMSARSMG